MAELQLYLLGPPRLERAGLPLNPGRRKALALLAYLAVTDQPHSRAALVAFLWPEYGHRRGRADLSRTLSLLRKTLGPTALVTDRKTVELNPEHKLWVDVRHFQQLLAVCKSHGHPENMVCAACLPPLKEAAGLYRADFLAGFTLPNSLDFDEWQFFQLEELRRDLVGALEGLGRGYTGQDNLAEALVYVRRRVGLDPLHEPAHRQLMTLYARTGQRAAAMRQYQVCEEVLARELGVLPHPETTALYEQIRRKREEPGDDSSERSYISAPLAVDPRAERPSSGPPRSSAVSPEQPTFLAQDQDPAVGPDVAFVDRLPEPEIHFCKSYDGVHIAHASVGQGPPLVKVANWLSHLEYDWHSPVWRHWLDGLSCCHTLIRYDERGCGLSDWDVEDFSVEAWVRDLEAVVEATGLERFPLLGISQGGPIAIAYAIRHPEKVSHLILYGTFARGWLKRSPQEIEEAETWLKLIKLGWERENPAYRQVFAGFFLPEGNAEQINWFIQLARLSTSTENAIKFQTAFYNIDVSDLAPKITVPTLVIHARNDAAAPFDEGRRLATLIPNAQFITLEGKNHIMLADEPAWPQFLAEVHQFLGVDG